MMYRLRRYDVFRFAQNDVAPFGRNDAMFAIKCGEATHHSKNAPLSQDKSAFFVGGDSWARTSDLLHVKQAL